MSDDHMDEAEIMPDAPGRELAIPAKAQLVANERGYIAPRTVEEAVRMARAVIAGRLAPDSYNNDEGKITLGIMAALEAGLPPLYGLRQIAIINGRPCLWGDACMALIQQSGNLKDQQITWNIPDGFDPNKVPISEWPDDYGCHVDLWRAGQETPYPGDFTVGDAKRARLWLNTRKTPWIEHPRRMLMIRARAFPQRDGFADALAGLSIREEIEDTFGNEPVPVEINLSNEPVVEAPPLEGV